MKTFKTILLSIWLVVTALFQVGLIFILYRYTWNSIHKLGEIWSIGIVLLVPILWTSLYMLIYSSWLMEGLRTFNLSIGKLGRKRKGADRYIKSLKELSEKVNFRYGLGTFEKYQNEPSFKAIKNSLYSVEGEYNRYISGKEDDILKELLENLEEIIDTKEYLKGNSNIYRVHKLEQARSKSVRQVKLLKEKQERARNKE